MEGEAILGGTRPERFRRMRDACIAFTVTVTVTLVSAVLAVCPSASEHGLSPALSDNISQHDT